MIEKIFAIVLSALGVLMGGVSFIFNGYKSLFDLFGRIGIGGMLVILAIIVVCNKHRRQKNLHFCSAEGCIERIKPEDTYCKHCNRIVEQDNSEPLGIQ